jgi:transposase-like protein
MISYLLPSASTIVKLERRCPHCNRTNGNIHSYIHHRRISDLRMASSPQRRMKCPFCGTTWTIHAQGITCGKHRSDRLIAFGVLLYMLGLSCRQVQMILNALDCKGSKSTIERDVRASGQKAKALHLQAPRLKVRTLGVDGTGAKMAGYKAGLLFFTDIERGKLLSVEAINETDTQKAREHIRRVMAEYGAQFLRTDELSVYEGVFSDDPDRHSICQAHWLKSKCKRAYELSRQLKTEGLDYESQTMLELKQLLHDKRSSPMVPAEVERLVRRFINCRRGTLWKVNQLLQHIERSWPYVAHGPGDPTNNVTERVIGLTYKIRAKTMRGFKSWEKVLSHPYLSEFLRGEEGICDLSKVV